MDAGIYDSHYGVLKSMMLRVDMVSTTTTLIASSMPDAKSVH